jgi:hypothetical protein
VEATIVASLVRNCKPCLPRFARLKEIDALERIFEILLAAGYSPKTVDWLRRRSLPAVIVMALAAWMVFVGVAWLLWSVLF